MSGILFVEDNQDYADILGMILANARPASYKITRVEKLSEALRVLNRETFDVILLDLSLPDSEGFNTFRQMFEHASEIPIVVITALDDKDLALQAVREGAQDYLVKGEQDVHQLPRALQYAIERHRTLQHLRYLSFVDDLTGLLNRRGFLELARQHLKLARRSQRELLLFFADLDGLKNINDTFGHPEGDQALRRLADVLRKTFRSSDIIARLGGDEYTVLAVDAVKSDLETILARLQEHIQQLNDANDRYQLSVSVGTAHYDPTNPISLDDLFLQADDALYQVKRARKNGIFGAQTELP